MQTIQLALGNAPYLGAVRDLLAHSHTYQVTTADKPDPKKSGVLVVNEDTLESLPLPVERPDRVVLITCNDPQRLSRAWEAGIRCVVFDTDPPRTIVLSVMAAALRVRSPSEAGHSAHFTQPVGVPSAKGEKAG